MSDFEPWNEDDPAQHSIAIVGLSGRFPGAQSPAELWSLLCAGREAISHFEEAELLEAGVAPQLLNQENYVKARGILDDIDRFDAQLFGFSPREAELLDPQQRVFLETAWEALEDAALDPERFDGLVGVYAGITMSSYLLTQIFPNRQLLASVAPLEIKLGNDKDFLATMTSYRLNLKGPSVVVSTACSSSLVAVHLALQALLAQECDVALAGGVSIGVPQVEGYLYDRTGINSRDGHCRAFDAQASGTVSGSGVGLVVLKRLDDAVAAGDRIYAVIRGSAINNDGAAKVGYTAPSVEGQASVIAEAQYAAGIEPETLSYVETHGTATPLGDVVEWRALTRAFRFGTDAEQFCALGSVKTNVGHLDAAAGVTGLIKTALALSHRQLPPSLHFETPNPEIEISTSPFFVQTELAPWPAGETPRRAGVSSFGMGGTNAHLILEEAPDIETTTGASPDDEARSPWHLLMFSGATQTALEANARRVSEHLELPTGASLGEAAHTLALGRRFLPQRRFAVVREPDELRRALQSPNSMTIGSVEPGRSPRIAFLFPGIGGLSRGGVRDLHQTEPAFREALDQVCDLLSRQHGFDPREILLEAPEAPRPGFDLRRMVRGGPSDDSLAGAMVAHPALFAVEWALAKTFMAWGVQPTALLGYSLGEYVAACLAGVIDLEDALRWVVTRAEWIDALPEGAMLALPVAADAARPFATAHGLSVAVEAGPILTVLSGPRSAIETLEEELSNTEMASRRLETRHAFHSSALDGLYPRLLELFSKASLNPPQIPFVSNVTGTWIRDPEATSPDYWARHTVQTIRFGDALNALRHHDIDCCLELGFGQGLSMLVRQHENASAHQPEQPSAEQPSAPALRAIHTLPEAYAGETAAASVLHALGQLWTVGATIDWPSFFEPRSPKTRATLPTYAFDRQRYWVGKASTDKASTTLGTASRVRDFDDWFYIPSWRTTLPSPALDLAEYPPARQRAWILFANDDDLSEALVERLDGEGCRTILIRRKDLQGQTLSEQATWLESLVAERAETFGEPGFVIHLWNTVPGVDQDPRLDAFDSLVAIGRALAARPSAHDARLLVASRSLHSVGGDPPPMPERSLLLGPVKVLPQEIAGLRTISVDLETTHPAPTAVTVDRLLAEIVRTSVDPVVAWRGRSRWVQHFEAVPLTKTAPKVRPLKTGGRYWLIGGLGTVGWMLAEHLARKFQARLILTSRRELPPASEWRERIANPNTDAATRQLLQRLVSLEEAGGQVRVERADAADAAAMARVWQRAEDAFGGVDGVFYAAAETRPEALFKSLLETDEAHADTQFRAKVLGAQVLDALIGERSLDFCLLLSSNASILGGLGFTAYAAANLFLDAFAASRTGPTPWISTNWDGWSDPDTASSAPQATAADTYFMSPDQALEAVERITTTAAVPQVVVSVGDLESRLERWLSDSGPPSPPSGTVHRRPGLSTPFVAPRNATEEALAEMIADLLRLQSVGVDDSFFDLGGHSLMATQLLLRIRQQFGLEVGLEALFNAPTVAGLAKVLLEIQAGQFEDSELTDLLGEIEDLSADELAAQLEGTEAELFKGDVS